MEQITTLTERVDVFTSCVEEIISKLTTSNASSSQQILPEQAAGYNGTAPPAMFMAGNGSTGATLVHNSASSSQLERESQIMEEVQYANVFFYIYSITSGKKYRHMKHELSISRLTEQAESRMHSQLAIIS